MTRLGLLIVLALSLAAVAAPAGLAGSAPLRITSISPTVAQRGELVTIAGAGLGARNLEVTVGGERVDVVSATGSRASFRVPLRGAVGDVEVVARNPGGITGRIGLRVRFDGVATVLLDDARRVSATIGREGGTLGAGRVSLNIPAGALSEDTSIAMTPLLDLADSPLSGSLIGGVKLEPEGLRFLKPALLSMPLPAGIPPASVLGFGSEGDGSDLHLQPRSVSDDSVSLALWHFSTAGASSGAGAAAAAVASRVPSSAETAAMQRIAVAEMACAAEQARGIEDGPACANQLNELASALSDWYRATVSPGLRDALGAPSFEIEAALAEWLFWQQETEVRLGGLLGPCGPMQLSCNDAHAAATAAVADMADRRLQNCTGTSLASQFRDVSRVADFADAGAIDLPGAGLPANLLHACAHLEIEVTDFPSIAALFHPNTLRGRVTVNVRSGPDRTDVPLTLTVDGAPVSTAADGTFQTTLTPGEAGPLDVELEAEANEPTLQIASFTATGNLNTPTRPRLKLVAQSPTTISAGGTVAFLVQVAGDGMSGATVTLSVGGPGSISPRPVTTNAGGEATSVYTAPAETAVPDASVTAVLPDGTSATIPLAITPLVTVSLSPTSATLASGGSRDFSATVTGSFLGVTWSATGGDIVTTGSTTARYEARSTPGTFSVTATSIADPSKRATATVTILSGPRGVTKTRSRGVATAGIVNANDGGLCGFRASPPLATAWSDSFSCNGPDQDGNTVTATAVGEFAETFESGELIRVVASGSGGGTQTDTASGSGSGTYILEFTVTRVMRMHVVATTEGNDIVFSLFGPGLNRFSRDPVTVDEVLTLSPGNYFVQVNGGAGGGSNGSFALLIDFGV